jgi:hypothetical protein
MFLDSNGKLLLSHRYTRPGDWVVALEGSSHALIMSPFENYVKHSDLSSEERTSYTSFFKDTEKEEYHRSYLFFGTCSFYPGKTIYENAEDVTGPG